MASRYYELVSRYYELVSRYYELVSRYFEILFFFFFFFFFFFENVLIGFRSAFVYICVFSSFISCIMCFREFIMLVEGHMVEWLF